jgi:hypothetical protein
MFPSFVFADSLTLQGLKHSEISDQFLLIGFYYDMLLIEGCNRLIFN